ncbi:DUF5693 family protein [Aminirod propionatiphilus]|uniref:Uncharacterized protein n=1 Tax=Aminirod propionatiphilus TaxID=3415223 RepID=A0ACD1DYG2_9BACT|nr:hypothetical protein KIH16_04215 [Synergistota bacterium]
MNGNRHKVFWGALSLALLLSFPGLFQRWSVEEATHTVGLVAAYRDVAALADQEGIEDEEALGLLQEAGLTGLMVGDLTGKELSNGALPLWFGPKNGLPSTWSGALEGDSDGAVVWVRQGDLDVDLVRRHVVARFGDVPFYEGEEGALFLLPLSLSALEEAAVLPDFEGLALSKELALPILFRPAPSHGLDGSAAMAALGAVLDENAQVRALAPSGPVVTAYPNVELLAEVVRERKLPLAKVEFSRQVGAIPLEWRVFPSLLPLHSVTAEEIQSRGLDGRQIVERMVRAARERSLRLLVMRPVSYSGPQTMEAFRADLLAISRGMGRHGPRLGWPEPIPLWQAGLPDAVALALVLVFSAMVLLWRIGGRYGEVMGVLPALLLGFFAVALGVVTWKVPFVARVVGAFAVPLFASAACLAALEGWRTPWKGLLEGLFILLVGGVAVAAFFGTPYFMLRLKAFSGVKLTLLLPPLFVLFHDLKRKVHPEGLGDLLRRPPLWGEIFLLVLLLGGAAVVAIRSGNVESVPQWEIDLRDFLEQWLVARPRTKETFIGYPALILWYLFRRRDWLPSYREVLRIGSTLAFASAANSFCHFHTHLIFTLWRVGNGVFLGCLFGVLAAFIVLHLIEPAWRRWGRILLD